MLQLFEYFLVGLVVGFVVTSLWLTEQIMNAIEVDEDENPISIDQ